MNKLTKEQKAKLVWELSIDVEHNPIYLSLEITVSNSNINL